MDGAGSSSTSRTSWFRNDLVIKPRRPQRSLDVPDHIWDPAKVRAEAEGTNLSVEIRQFLIRYGKGKK
jgi:hypothetical protein